MLESNKLIVNFNFFRKIVEYFKKFERKTHDTTITRTYIMTQNCYISNFIEKRTFSMVPYFPKRHSNMLDSNKFVVNFNLKKKISKSAKNGAVTFGRKCA